MLVSKTTIHGKLLRLILLINISVLVLTCSIFFAYEYLTFRQARMREVTALGKIIAENSAVTLTARDSTAGRETLHALQAESRIVAACIYDADGRLFASFPSTLPAISIPPSPAQDGLIFISNALEGYQPIMHGDQRLGTLYIKYTMRALHERLEGYAVVSGAVMLLALLLAYIIYMRLRSRISKPILELANTARDISDNNNFSVRAGKSTDDEIGLLTEAFNRMLDKIEQQTTDLKKHTEDIQAREQRFKILIENNNDVMTMTDKNLNVFYQSPQGESVTGFTEAERSKLSPQDVLHPDDIRMLADVYPKLMNEPEQAIPFQYRFRHKQGHYIWLEGTLKNLLNDPYIHAIVVNFRDITEKKNSEKEILKLNAELEERVAKRTEELEQANKELESFSYSVSHDLRAPLRSIQGYVNMLQDEYGKQLDEEGNRLMDIILKNGQRMGRLIDDLLAFSKLGRAELKRSMISMHDLVREVVDDCLKGEDHRKIDVHIKPLPDARADSATMKQVWVNLISNAFKYSKHNAHTNIDIGFSENEKEITYFVKDNGAGFDMKYYDKLFGVFQRLHSMKEFEGTGVGLAIVQRIIARHGGKIRAEAKVNEGATFYFTLDKQLSI